MITQVTEVSFYTDHSLKKLIPYFLFLTSVMRTIIEYAKNLIIDLNMTDGDYNFNRNAITSKEYKMSNCCFKVPKLMFIPLISNWID